MRSADDTKQGNCKLESILMRSAEISLQYALPTNSPINEGVRRQCSVHSFVLLKFYPPAEGCAAAVAARWMALNSLNLTAEI